MHWLLAIMGAWLGALAGAADRSLLGFVLGAVLGWQGGRLLLLRRRIEALEQSRQRDLQVALAAARAAAASEATATPGMAAPASAAASEPTAAREAPPADPVTEMANATESRPTAAAAPTPARMEAAPAESQTAAAASPAAGPAPPPPPPAPPATPRPSPARSGAPRSPAPPANPAWVDELGGWLRRLLFEGNVPVKIGVLVLFAGVAAALKYAADAGWVRFPIELRLAGIALAALAGLVWGWRERLARPAFGLSLQGGAIGVLLLVVFASYRLYALLPAGGAFGLVLLLVAGAAALAVLQNAVWLALLGLIGGYLAPVLISTGSGNHVALFSYYALLNAAVFGIAWLRAWRALNLVGFAFTFAVGTLWGIEFYRPEHYATLQPFLILFVAFYIAIAVLHAIRGRKPLVDGTLVFGTPLLGFPLQAALLSDDRMGLAFSALALALVYTGLALWLRTRRGLEVLWQSFAILALGFATLAVPLAFSARATSATWALEGAALIWLGLRQSRRLPQAIGWLLQGLAACAFLLALSEYGWHAEPGDWAVVNGQTLGLFLLALSGFAVALTYERHAGGRVPVWTGFLLGLAWWGVAGLREIDTFDYADRGLVEVQGFALITLLVALLARLALSWPRPGWIALLVALAGPPLVLAMVLDDLPLLALPQAGLWTLWAASMLAALALLREPQQRGLSLVHIALFWTLALWLGFGLSRLAGDAELGSGWQLLAGALPLILLLLGSWRLPDLVAWPLAERFPHYRLRWILPAAILLTGLWLLSLTDRGDPAPLPFLPLLNPLELAQLVLLLLAWRAADETVDAGPLRGLLALAGLLWLSVAGLRGAHWLGDAPWSPELMFDPVAQATLSVLWSLAGVAAWVAGSKRRDWPLWLVGAVLMGVVLAKLVIVDRQYMGDLAGIVSFLAVGGLLVLVGRIAPTPPRNADGAPA